MIVLIDCVKVTIFGYFFIKLFTILSKRFFNSFFDKKFKKNDFFLVKSIYFDRASV